MCLAGNVAWARGDPVRARSHLQDGLRIARQARDLEGEAFARTGLMEVGLCQGPFHEAVEHGQAAGQLWRRLGHRPMVNRVSGTLGVLRLVAGDRDEAKQLLDVALAGARELGMRRDEPLPMIGVALDEYRRGDVGRALATLDEAIEIADEHAVTLGSVVGRLARVSILQELDAVGSVLSTVDEMDATGSWVLGAARHAAVAWTYLREGERERARAGFLDARAGAESMLLSRLVCGRVELVGWSRAGDHEAASDAAGWLLAGARGQCPAVEALATQARVRAGHDEGDPARLVESAARADDASVMWRALALAARIADERGEPAVAEARRREAASLLRTLAASIRDDTLRHGFLAARDVAEALD
jgi:tetratricopeptide (TPR) repeat protein